IWNDQLSIPGILDLSLSINVTKKLSADIQSSTKIERKFGVPSRGPSYVPPPSSFGALLSQAHRQHLPFAGAA
ncbi:unnamed protein product, partial [Adineta steineri]